MSTARPYRSQLRAEQAHATKQRIRSSARQLFTEQGFANTTVNEIAAHAGVAAPTVYGAYRGKSGLVLAMLEELEESADIAAWTATIRAEPDPGRQLALFVAWNRTLFEQGAPILRAYMAARNDPDVAAMGEQGDAHRMAAAAELTDRWATAGALRVSLGPTEAAERLWLLTSPEQFLLAIDTLGWAPGQYEDWLGALLRRDLFHDDDQ